MIGPVWIAAILGIVMLVVAAATLVRIVLALRTRSSIDFEVDFHNVVMGIGMAGMLIPSLLIVTNGPSTVAWILVWVAITAWFAVSIARDAVRRESGHSFAGHHLPHLVMSGAMTYMFAVMNSTGAGVPMSSMTGMSAGTILVPLPTLDYAFVILMLGYAVIVIDRLPIIAQLPPVAHRGSGDLPHAVHTAAKPFAVTLAPRAAALANVVMALTMAYMLTMMFA